MTGCFPFPLDCIIWIACNEKQIYPSCQRMALLCSVYRPVKAGKHLKGHDQFLRWWCLIQVLDFITLEPIFVDLSILRTALESKQRAPVWSILDEKPHHYSSTSNMPRADLAHHGSWPLNWVTERKRREESRAADVYLSDWMPFFKVPV